MKIFRQILALPFYVGGILLWWVGERVEGAPYWTVSTGTEVKK